jgi:hypothetical protein
MAFQNSGWSTAQEGRFDDIKKTISYSLHTAWINLGTALTL